MRNFVFLRTFIFALGLICASDAALAGIMSKIKTAAGLGFPRETICLATLETIVAYAGKNSLPNSYAIQNLEAIGMSLKEKGKPAIENGYAMVRDGSVYEGTLSTAQLSSRLKAVLSLEAKSPDETMKAISFSATDYYATESIVEMRSRLEEYRKASKFFIPVALAFQGGIAAGITLIASHFMAEPRIDIAMMLAGTSLFISPKKLMPGHQSVDNIETLLERFMAESQPGKRSFLVLSYSGRIDKGIIAKTISPLITESSSAVRKQFNIYANRLPVTEQVAALSGDPWVHSDFVVEMNPDGYTETYGIVQFTQGQPNYPKKPKEKLSPKTMSLLELQR